MSAVLPQTAAGVTGRVFELEADAAYRRWRDWKLARRARDADALTVEVADPRALSAAEREALLARIAASNMALYRSPIRHEDKRLPRALGAQLGLHRLDANWLADEDGISSIAVSDRSDAGGRGGFIPYTDRAIRWHTDGYYHPQQRRIHAMILHCVRPAQRGGGNALLDHELAYITLRDASPDHIRALMQPDAMTIPAREDEGGVARAAQSGPVFSIDAQDRLHMRYTARTRSIEWKDDAATRAAVACLEALLVGDSPSIVRLRLDAGMGFVGHNVLHERSAFVDDPAHPRLLYRARFLDRIANPKDDPDNDTPAQAAAASWRNG
ncbi:MAG: TauD/TfdA family dioxygenase [Rhizobacter sp.]|nr:TauD/TfdA family dioxygenase [Rhizobacter sp.]